MRLITYKVEIKFTSGILREIETHFDMRLPEGSKSPFKIGQHIKTQGTCASYEITNVEKGPSYDSQHHAS